MRVEEWTEGRPLGAINIPGMARSGWVAGGVYTVTPCLRNTQTNEMNIKKHTTARHPAYTKQKKIKNKNLSDEILKQTTEEKTYLTDSQKRDLDVSRGVLP